MSTECPCEMCDECVSERFRKALAVDDRPTMTDMLIALIAADRLSLAAQLLGLAVADREDG